MLAHNRRLVQAFVDALPAPWRVRVRRSGIGGTLCIPLGAAFEPVTRALGAAGVRFDTRGEVLRLSFHLCNDLDDAVRIAGAWRSC